MYNVIAKHNAGSGQIAAVSMNKRQTLDLGGQDWRIGCVKCRPTADMAAWDVDAVEEWLPATVPGDVRADLLDSKRIPDPYVGLDNELSQWVDERDWWYRKDLDLRLDEGERAFVVFHGVDYLSAVFLDGRLLGTHEGMFSRHTYEITDLVRGAPHHHELAVRIVGPASLPPPELTWYEKLWNSVSSRIPHGSQAFPDRFGVLKCQMGYGWDFAAKIRTIGIWDRVSLVVVRSVHILDPRVTTELMEDVAQINVDFTLDSDHDQTVTAGIHVRLKGAADDEATRSLQLDLMPGQKRYSACLHVQNAKLWNPWDRGPAHLYDLTIEITRNQAGTVVALDDDKVQFGIRDIALTPPPELLTAKPYIFTVNERREYIRGANWVPLDAMPGRARRADYAQLLDRARSAGINMLRVWGGGLREKSEFYELCDEKGILVWQDFPFACAFFGYYLLRGRFPALAQQEVTDIVRQLRNHPSVAVWCGGNEFSPRRNRRLIRLVGEITSREDGTRPFRRVSPDQGEAHNWRIWHSKASVGYFRRDRSHILGEFGLQAVPDIESLRRFLTPGHLWPPNGEWTYHGAELNKMEHYLKPWFSFPGCTDNTMFEGCEPRSLEEFVTASQKAQAHGVQVAVEHVRRRKGETGGSLVWQLNDPWPAISWSLIDYYRRPKAAYYKLAQVYNPVLISVLYPLRRYRRGQTLHLDIWAINDLLQPIDDARLEVLLDDQVIATYRVSLPSDSRRLIDRLAHRLDHAPVRLLVRLIEGERVVSTNDYDLRYESSRERSWPDHLFGWIGDVMLKAV